MKKQLRKYLLEPPLGGWGLIQGAGVRRIRFYSLCCILVVSFISNTQAQVAKVSFNNAYNMLNSGNKYGSTSTSTSINIGGTGMNTVYLGNYTKKAKISYGIPIAILFEFIVVKINLGSDLASDPDIYNNCSDNVQQAIVNLAYSDFVKISDYNRVNVKLNFQFNPAKLVIYGSDQGDFMNNTQSSPWDVGVYKAPNTPVSGSKIMVVKK